jgi:uncharacterized protein involved in exopolysaccharide biosynthesis
MSEFLREQWGQAEERLSASEAELAEFLSAHPEFADEAVTVTGAAGASVRARERKTQETTTTDSGLLALRRQRSRIRAQLDARPTRALRRDGASKAGPLSKGEVQAEAAIAKARRDLDAALSDLTRRSAVYTPQHPDVVAAAARVRDARAQLKRAEIRGKAARTAGRSQAARGRSAPAQELSPDRRRALLGELRRIDNAIARHRKKRGATPAPAPAADLVVELETEWARLHRGVRQARERYDDLESKAFTAAIIESSRTGAPGTQLAILDPASRPTHPLGASTRLLCMAAAVVFGGLGLVVSITMGVLDDRLVHGSDIQRLGVAPLLAAVPAARRSHATTSK